MRFSHDFEAGGGFCFVKSPLSMMAALRTQPVSGTLADEAAETGDSAVSVDAGWGPGSVAADSARRLYAGDWRTAVTMATRSSSTR